MEISKKYWDKTSLGEEVFIYNLKNDFLEIEILNYGGIIKSIKMPNKNGFMENIVLGFNNFSDYEKNPAFFGAIIGRTSGRIKNAKLKIDDKIYNLTKNSNENNIHGGKNNFSHKIWKSQIIEDNDKKILELKLHSPHLEEGYPGNLDIRILYILDENELKIKYFAKTDRKTFLNLTNHSYFNLSGNHKREIIDEILCINADNFIEVDMQTLPKRISKVDNRVFDFRNEKKFYKLFIKGDEQVEIVNHGLDHPFIINKNNKPCIALFDEISKRKLEIFTTENVVVIYSGNFLEDVPSFNKYSGIAFETQNYPDAINFMPSKANFIDENHDYMQETIYKFELLED